MKSNFFLIELFAVICLIVFLAADAVPNYVEVKDSAKEAEVKENLHHLQLSVERFAVDSEGNYPQYLIGGDAKYGDPTSSENIKAKGIEGIESLKFAYSISDPLLRHGYIDSYPKNPFASNPSQINKYQIDMNDPLSNTGEGKGNVNPTIYSCKGTRFGGDCSLMGQVLADYRFPTFAWKKPGQKPLIANTRADVAYPQYDIWQKDEPKFFLPGTFYYKSNGTHIINLNKPEINALIPTEPNEITQYIMGAYGSSRTKGIDVLGSEKQWSISTTTKTQSGVFQHSITGTGAKIQFWPWTRSEEVEPYRGDPYGLPVNSMLNNISYGNPNGIRDAIILTLNAGEDTEMSEE